MDIISVTEILRRYVETERPRYTSLGAAWAGFLGYLEQRHGGDVADSYYADTKALLPQVQQCVEAKDWGNPLLQEFDSDPVVRGAFERFRSEHELN